MMSPSLLLVSGVVFFSSVALPTLSFSHGASHASCLEMIPGHIRAHPLDPHHSFVIFHASASSYLPGQLITGTDPITLTVRSSRDFMGFLLQARGAGDQRRRYGRGARIRSRRIGPPLVIGSWILTPPGTHTLHCLSEGDTITHSDKQLKRNLSFVWRAPDKPMGDVQFHITVVQSYFIYWAGVESAVVRDGNRSVWRGGETAGPLDIGSMSFSFQEENTTDLSGGGDQTQKFVNTGVAPTMVELTNFETLTKLEENPTIPLALGSIQSKTSSTPESQSKMSEKATVDPGSHTKGPRSSSLSPPSVTTAENQKMDTTTTDQTWTSPGSLLNSLVPFFPQKGIGTWMKDPGINSQDPLLNINQKGNDTLVSESSSSAMSGTINRSKEADGNEQTLSRTSSVKGETGSLSITSSKPDSRFHTTSRQMYLYTETSSPKPQTWSPKTLSPSISTPKSSQVTKAGPPSLDPVHDTSPSGSKSTTKPTTLFQMSQSSPPPASSPSIPHQALGTTSISTQTKPDFVHRDQSQSETTEESLDTSPQPQSQTLLKTRRTSSSRPDNPVTSTSTTPDLRFVSSLTPSPTFTSPNHLSSGSSGDPSHSSSFIHPSDPASSHPSEYSVLVSTHPSSRPTTPIHSSSSFQTKHLRATMAISALPSPLPISTPSHLPSAPSPSTPTSSTTQPSSFNPPTDSLFSTAAVSTNPNSSHCFLFSNISSPSTVTKVSSSTSKPTSFASPPPSLPPTSTSTPLSVGGSSSSSYVSSITTPHPGPLSSIHLLPQTPVTSSVPSKKTTEGQRVGIPLTSSNPVTNLGSPTQTTVIHLNPKPFPNHKLNRGQKTKPELPNIDTKPKKPSGPSEGPDKKGKYPDINPRHSTWELAMLLGCSAGLGMVLVVGVRYMYRQACGRWTEVTLNDREREYDRGGRGLIQVQECGDLVRVRKIRENSFVLLTEYDVLAPPGE
nr:uncharacterized protein LOC107376807 [Nothobranchius furzeri]